MKTIPLTQGFTAMVDDSDYEFLSQFKWTAAVQRGKHTTRVYAFRGSGREGGRKVLYMHHMILGSRQRVDHHDGNGINNQRHNLRHATYSQNSANRVKVEGRFRFKGVHFRINRPTRPWYAIIKFQGKIHHLGHFEDEVDAARAYNSAAHFFFGEFARPNDIPTAA